MADFKTNLGLLQRILENASEWDPDADEAYILANWEQIKPKIQNLLGEVGDLLKKIG